MGNDHSQSQLPDLEIEQKAIEVTDFWVHYSARITSNSRNLSVLIGEPVFGGSLWVSHTPLEKTSKNLMLYRHPCILKYVASWSKSSKFYLAVEDVKPLSHVLSTLGKLQICIGLHAILKALCFLHDKALVSHNNICVASIYVTKDGNWKLGGMEYLCSFRDLNFEYLSKSRNSRYDKAIDPNEGTYIQDGKASKGFIDSFAFGVLACEILKNVEQDDELLYLTEFLNICKNDLRSVDVASRPKLELLLSHPFFNHEFIALHSFLTELPLKTDEEKAVFFHQIVEKLNNFEEEIVASQLSSLLLSRMVLLNKTAQTELLPYILRPNKDPHESKNLFSLDSFKKHLVPKLLEIFCVRDAEIRKLLLKYFTNYADTFSKEELQNLILPELLVGIKDTNDGLVAETLRALADVVPILGSSTVIGGKRAKLFNDGRPTSHPVKSFRRSSRNNRQADAIVVNLASEVLLDLPERPRPDGEEGDTSAEDVDQVVEEDLEWEDWDVNDNANRSLEFETVSSEMNVLSPEINNSVKVQSLELKNTFKSVSNLNAHKNINLTDISTLDIKTSDTANDEEFNFFQGMEPVIETSSTFLLDIVQDASHDFKKLSCAESEIREDGWDDEWDN